MIPLTPNRFYFSSRDAFDAKQSSLPDYVEDTSFQGIFYDWLLKGILEYAF